MERLPIEGACGRSGGRDAPKSRPTEPRRDQAAGFCYADAMLLGGSSMVAVGFALWLYGVNSGTIPRWIDWPSGAPSWLYEAAPNFESEIGLLIALLGVAALLLPLRS